MLDPIKAFEDQFTPVEGGYLYYPSPNSAGKLVTAQEYEQLLSDWRRLASKRGMWKFTGAIIVILIVWALIATAVSIPDSATTSLIIAAAALLVARVFWVSLAPRRLVKNRPASAPPRPAGQARRQARSAIGWPTVLIVTLVSGAIFWAMIRSPTGDLTWWAWLVGSGFLFVSYLGIAIMKLRDRLNSP